MENNQVTIFQKTISEHEGYIWIKPVCDFFEINYENQTRTFKNDPILKNHSTKKSNSLLFGDNYRRILVSKIGFIRWIQIVNQNLVNENLREKFISYQEKVTEFLYGNFTARETVKVEYTRLKKLKSLYAKIGREIQILNNSINNYLDTTFIQTSIDFNQQKQIN